MIIGSYKYPYSTTTVMRTTGRYWQLLAVDDNWELPISILNCTSTVNYWQLLADTGSYWQMLAVDDTWGYLVHISTLN